MSSDSILILVDDFGQGGTQRQIAMLVREFVRRGRPVMVVRYAEHDFLGKEIEAAGAEVIRLQGRSRLGWIHSLTRLVAQRCPAVACAFLNGPASLALLSDRLRHWPCPIVVCERATDPEGPINFRRRMNLWLYRGAASIICNSERQAVWLREACPAIQGRVEYIGNTVDQNHFRFSEHPTGMVRKIVVLGRVVEGKGVGVLARAAQLMRARADCEDLLPITWYGQQHEEGPRLCTDAGASSDGIVFRPPVDDVAGVLARADALLLPSLAEATPNVILEAMAVGRVVIATDVGDITRLVMNGSNGWLASPGDADSLLRALVSARNASDVEVRKMSRAARAHVEKIASINMIVDDYEAVFSRIGVDL